MKISLRQLEVFDAAATCGSVIDKAGDGLTQAETAKGLSGKAKRVYSIKL